MSAPMDKLIVVAPLPLYATAIRKADANDDAIEAVWQTIRQMRQSVSMHRQAVAPIVFTCHEVDGVYQVGLWQPKT